MKKIIFLIFTFTLMGQIYASSRVIRDNRLDDLGVTPALGRGYSIATNTYQSLCMDKVVVTTPSYNFKYNFVEIEKDWETKLETSLDTSKSMRYLFLKANVNVHSEGTAENKYHYHYMMP